MNLIANSFSQTACVCGVFAAYMDGTPLLEILFGKIVRVICNSFDEVHHSNTPCVNHHQNDILTKPQNSVLKDFKIPCPLPLSEKINLYSTK